MKRPRSPWRKPPYYKVRLFDALINTWRDEQRAYDDLASAREAASSNSRGLPWRVVHITEDGRSIVAEGVVVNRVSPAAEDVSGKAPDTADRHITPRRRR